MSEDPAALSRVGVGIDGGQSQIRLRITGEQSAPVIDVAGVSHGVDLEHRLKASIMLAWELAERPAVQRLVAGLTALPAEPARITALADGLSVGTGAAEVWLMDDAVTAHRAAFAGTSGIVLVIGTGVGCLALDSATGRWHRTSGAGYLIGDEGGTLWIGREGLAHAIKSHDGRGPATSLLDAALIRFDTSADDLAVRVHNHERPVSAVADFAVSVFECATAGDAVALSIVTAAAVELASCVESCLTALPNSGSCGVVLMGRAVATSSPLAIALIEILESTQPSLRVEVAVATPLDGACALASDPDAGAYSPFILAISSGQNRAIHDRQPGSAAAAYLSSTAGLLGQAVGAEFDAITRAASHIADRLERGAMIHTFGTGHSHLLAAEIFYRAGGLARVDPILIGELMLHESASGSTSVERRAGLVDDIIAGHPMQAGDVLIVASNSGGNAASVELAQWARAHDILVIALTSLRHATSSSARASAVPRLHEVADVVLDNHGVVGDAGTPIAGSDRQVGPTSTVIGSALLQALIAEVIAVLVDRGIDPEVFASSNTVGGDEINATLIARYQGKVRSL
jgi:uncharacterized phosphosugar-binding protein/N-acetylglucosamine kinase-like BadF-type ATPase